VDPMAYVVVVGGFVVVLFGILSLNNITTARLRLRQAEAERSGGAAPRELEDAVAQLQHRVAELEERQDFAERLLAQAREKGLLGPGEGK